MPLPEKDEMFNTKGKMLQDITVALGGRVAEEEIFNDITTGASQDIKQATSLAKIHGNKIRYVREAGGLSNYDNDNDEVFIGRDLPTPQEDTASRWPAPLTRSQRHY